MESYPPTGDEFRAYLDTHNYTSREVADLLLLPDKQGRSVRQWATGRKTMPYAAWFTLRSLIEGIPPMRNIEDG